MVDSMFSVLGYLKGFVLTNHWSTIDLVKDIKSPILYITGAKDEIVPTLQTQALYVASSSSRHAQLWVNPEGTHNDTWFSSRDDYLATLRHFMKKQNEDGLKLRTPKKKPLEDGQVRRVVKFATIIEPAPPKDNGAANSKEDNQEL